MRITFLGTRGNIELRNRRHRRHSALLIRHRTQPILRKHDGVLLGHAPIRTQLGWCRDAGVSRAVFTHCGSEIVGGDERRLGPKVRALARGCGVAARIAYDGLEMSCPEFRASRHARVA